MFILSSTTGSPREQIHLDGKKISEDLFTAYFFDVLDRLSIHERVNLDICAEVPDDPQFNTLLAFHIFIQENVYAAILEVSTESAHDQLDHLLHPVTVGMLSGDIASVYPSGREIEAPTVIPVCATNAIDNSPNISEEPISNIVLATALPELASIELGLTDSDAREDATLAVHIARAFFSAVDPFFKLVYSTPPLPGSFIIGLQKSRAFALWRGS
ncbi:hypothetical protein NP233_g4810 [Leucocoprinus birnbaumii]|uniref:Uncharacterized protein n=1 Tax=Leucocoprinus birnbaumii TaxID=56174 RepID=A0AAD5VU24_9AGAR|nr:hypothetical protein NP233_g4810 [Leucocoprinus birnbaumii]